VVEAALQVCRVVLVIDKGYLESQLSIKAAHILLLNLV
jgi:hypothetical protein